MAKVPGEIPQYRKIYEILRKQILDGVFEAGSILPSESELKKTHHVTQPVVRQALALLVNDGLIKKRQGKGSIVQPKTIGVGILSIEGMDVTSQDIEKGISTKILKGPQIIDWPEELTGKINDAERDAGCLAIERRRLVNNVPVFYEFLWFPNINLPRFTSRKLDDKSFYDILREHYQVSVTASEQKISAVAADEQISGYLDTTANKPVLKLERKMETNRVDFSIYSLLFANTEKYYLYGKS